MSTLLLTLWAALMAADRIDFAGGRGGFLITPFIVLTPLVILSEIVRRYLRGRDVRLDQSVLIYAVSAGAFIAVSAASALVAPDVSIAASRILLLILNIVGTLVIAVLGADRRNLWRALARGALVWLALSLAFDVVESIIVHLLLLEPAPSVGCC